MQHARDRIREFTGPAPAAAAGRSAIVEELNRFLRGWAGYFRYGNSAQRFSQIRDYAAMRLARFICRRNIAAPERSVGGVDRLRAGQSARA